MTPERQDELRKLGEKYGHPASSLIEQAADYIELLEKRASDMNIKAARLKQELGALKESA